MLHLHQHILTSHSHGLPQAQDRSCAFWGLDRHTVTSVLQDSITQSRLMALGLHGGPVPLAL